MKFLWSTLKVKDMEQSLEFYQEVLGLPISNRFSVGPDVEIAFLGDGATKIELIADHHYQEVDPGKGITLGFLVESLEKMMDMLHQKEIAVLEGPIKPNPGTQFLFISDPDGYRIQLVEETNMQEGGAHH